MNPTAYNTDKYRVLVEGEKITLLDPATWGTKGAFTVPKDDPSLCRTLIVIFKDWADSGSGSTGGQNEDAGEKDSPGVKDDAPAPSKPKRKTSK